VILVTIDKFERQHCRIRVTLRIAHRKACARKDRPLLAICGPESYHFKSQFCAGRLPMVFGMSLATYTLIHVIISLIGIGSGLVVLFGMFGGKRLDGITALFLATTALTSLTGFGFPFEHVTPGIILGVLSLLV